MWIHNIILACYSRQFVMPHPIGLGRVVELDTVLENSGQQWFGKMFIFHLFSELFVTIFIVSVRVQ